jgi:hypothetical protein
MHGGENQLRAPCPACRNGGQRAIVITPAHCFSSKAGGDQNALVSRVKDVSQKDAAALMLGAETKGTVQSTSTVQNGTSTIPPQDHFPPLDYLEFDHVVVESLRIDTSTAEALGIGYAPKGMMKGYVAVPVRLPTGELTGYIGIAEGKVPKEFHLSRVVTFPKKSA